MDEQHANPAQVAPVGRGGDGGNRLAASAHPVCHGCLTHEAAIGRQAQKAPQVADGLVAPLRQPAQPQRGGDVIGGHRADGKFGHGNPLNHETAFPAGLPLR